MSDPVDRVRRFIARRRASPGVRRGRIDRSGSYSHAFQIGTHHVGHAIQARGEEARESFKQEALASWAAYQETGRHLTGQEVRTWLNTWGSDDERAVPECHE